MTSSSVGIRKFGTENWDRWRLFDGMDEGVAAWRRLIMKRERRSEGKLGDVRAIRTRIKGAYIGIT